MAVIATPNPTTISPQCPTVPDNALAITPSDTDTFAKGVAVYVGVAGTVSCVPWGGNAAVTVTAVAGALLPFRVIKVNATNTTATGLLAVY
ncbi:MULTISPECIES: spike base protein, RCAP_Rcc01079 family [unclassified Stenotrophomonas maltophilia group]|uniref:spike base protein, RCAP_Rcc01079 family n=1 Tax=unclassified Stenotrophomonas maltophilia group TaxID=2961925 RepID=UPI003BF8AE05